MIKIRAAHLDDAEHIARVHVQSWRESYCEIAPKDVLEQLDIAARQAQWRQGLSLGESGPLIFVAEDDGAIIGFISVSKTNEPLIAPHPMVKTLYILESHKRRGIGQSLMKTMAKALAERSSTGFGLGVLVENAPAQAFYTKMGGKKVGQITSPGPVWRSVEDVFLFDGTRFQALLL